MSDSLFSDDASGITSPQNVRPIWLAPSASSAQFLACVHASLQERIRHAMLDFESQAFAEAAANEAYQSALSLSRTFSASLPSHRLYQYWRSLKWQSEDDPPSA